MKKFLFKLVIKLMRSKFSRQQVDRLTETAEPARVRLRQWLLREPSTAQEATSGGLGAKLEFFRQALRRWLLSDTATSSVGLAQGESRGQGL